MYFRKFTAKIFNKIKQSKVLSFLILFLALYIMYKNYQNISFTVELSKRVEIAKEKYDRVKKEKIEEVNRIEDLKTDVAKARYEKEFFNKTDIGETVVILHKKSEDKNRQEEELLEFNFVDRVSQKIKLWWKNR